MHERPFELHDAPHREAHAGVPHREAPHHEPEPSPRDLSASYTMNLYKSSLKSLFWRIRSHGIRAQFYVCSGFRARPSAILATRERVVR